VSFTPLSYSDEVIDISFVQCVSQVLAHRDETDMAPLDAIGRTADVRSSGPSVDPDSVDMYAVAVSR
jgi:hypothetical protein